MRGLIMLGIVLLFGTTGCVATETKTTTRTIGLEASNTWSGLDSGKTE